MEISEPTGADTFVITSNQSEQKLTSRLRANATVQSGETIELAVNMDKAHFFDPDSGQRIG